MALNLLISRAAMKRLLGCAVLLCAAVASAQTVVTPQISLRRVGDTTNDTYTFGAAQCGDTITVQWQNTTTIAYVTTCSSNSMKVWSTAGECSNAPPADAVRYDDIPGLTLQGIKQGTFNVKLAELPGFNTAVTTDGGVVACGTTGITKQHRVCASIEYATFTGVTCGTTTTATASPLKLVYDTQPPSAPTITEYGAQDQGVKLGFTTDTDTTTVALEVRAMSEVDYTQIKEAVASNKSITGTGLVNGTTYDVRLRGIDGAGNISDPSVSIAVTPLKTLGFYGYYRSIGGTDKGCSAGWGLVPVLGVWLLARRFRRKSS
jgi:hypothetical protein